MINSLGESLELVKIASIEFGPKVIEGELILPENASGIVVIAHGRGSSQGSPRNRAVARVLRERGFGTLLIDLETTDERDRASATDCQEMAVRVLLASDWLSEEGFAPRLPVGFFGSGTGAAAILRAVCERPAATNVIVARGARVELAEDSLPKVSAPTLLIVGALDTEVVQRNRDAVDRLGSPFKELRIVPGAHHFFEEPGTLAAAALHAANWFDRHFPPRIDPPSPNGNRSSYAYGGL